MTADTAEELTAVLLPGLHGSSELFGPFEAACPAGYRTLPVAYPSEPATVSQLVDLVLRSVPRARWLLVAESFSGLVAIKLAASHPPGLMALVLVATAAKWSRLRWLRSVPLTAMFALHTPTPLLRWLLIGDAPPELLAATRKAITAVPPAVLATRLRELAIADVRPQLDQVDVPILYLRAQRDHVARRAELGSVNSGRRQVDVRVVDAPHFLLQSQPTVAWQHLTSFVRFRCVA